MNTSERLKRIMEVKGFNLKTFAEQSDIPYRTLQNYILSGREPNAEALMKLHTRLGINLNWLVSGDGQMFNSKLEVSDLSQGEMNLINNYQTMSEDIKTAFNILFNKISNK
ncbi:helix-turn-helix domain-containing protein [Aggregatibacter actinomycetemcomitans]|uniref:helix-turn-helix domain-containing protein n=1 Tax=Aggregatibacter actinomycetemcomitans TaxID=714 RepID=UPI0011DDDD32|nr:helix-turn-helix domain-containing protein [Aggregatibacter actinomycetemcomitans]QEH48416.1 bacteriophage CI repressor [Aggregatibacter actinomycetemcomitans]